MIVDHPGQIHDARVVRQQAAPVQTHVDFKKQSHGLPMGRRPLARHLDALLRVGHHAHVGALSLCGGQQPVPLRRRYHRPADGDGFEPALDEDLRFVDRGDSDARRTQADLPPSDLQGLVGLDVGTQRDAVPVRQVLQGAQIAHHPGLIEQYDRRFHLVEHVVCAHGWIRHRVTNG